MQLHRLLPIIACIAIYLIEPANTKAQSITTQDSLVLVDFYNSTNGPTWKSHIGWLTAAPAIGWQGVVVQNSRVVEINLGNNNLTGTIPVPLGSLLQLYQLDLHYNHLTDTIPSSIGNLSLLTKLDLSVNKLTGVIPLSFGNFSVINVLNLANNHLSDSIPSVLGNLAQLTNLNLFDNDLTGTIPVTLGNLPNVTYIALNYNLLTGSIPPEIGKLTQLTALGLDYNHLTGNLPPEIGNLTKLQGFGLNNNSLSGAIPASMSNLTSLVAFSLANNQFTFNGMEELVAALFFATYAPQANIGIQNNNGTLSVAAGGTPTNNTYKWYINGTLAATKTGDSTLAITTPGKYNVDVTNAVATNLTLHSDTLIVSTLPLTLLNFTAALQKSAVALQWQTANEINTSHFNVQRSNDALHFTTIGQVAALGNSVNTHGYNYTDLLSANDIQIPNIYYRLLQVDKNGQLSYSRVISITIGGATIAALVYPNPSHNTASVAFNSSAVGKYTITLTNLQGKVIKQISGTAARGLNKVTIGVNTYAQGVYLITIVGADNGKQVLKLVKE